MRITIEITEEQRARLMEIAARRGVRGYSRIVQQALNAYIAADDDASNKLRRALALRGTLAEADAETLRAMVRDIRT